MKLALNLFYLARLEDQSLSRFLYSEELRKKYEPALTSLQVPPFKRGMGLCQGQIRKV